jgi:hypothetical protein
MLLMCAHQTHIAMIQACSSVQFCRLTFAIVKHQKTKAMRHATGSSIKASSIIGRAAALLFTCFFIGTGLIYADGIKQGRVGGLIKVHGDVQADRFESMGLTVKAVMGHLLSVEMPAAGTADISALRGISSMVLDRCGEGMKRTDLSGVADRYAGAHAIIGILDNASALSPSDMALMQKVETAQNIGFISYRSDDPSSNVIMRNLRGSESDMIQALTYMQRYASTVGLPLFIEMNLQRSAETNPLFAQACQHLAEEGVHFVNRSTDAVGHLIQPQMQYALRMFNSEAGTISDRMFFFSMDEAKGREMMMVGSDGHPCSFQFNAADGIRVANSSSDVVLMQVLDSHGNIHHYHINTAMAQLRPVVLTNGIPVMDNGSTSIYPFMSKRTVLGDVNASVGVETLELSHRPLALSLRQGAALKVSSDHAHRIVLQLSDQRPGTLLQLTDRHGEVLYRSNLQKDTRSLETRIDLSGRDYSFLFLTVSCPEAKDETFALRMN